MRINFALVPWVLLLATAAEAQKPTAHYQSEAAVGSVNGEYGSAVQLQSINGITYKRWSAGIGVGLDYYYVRSVPLFIDVRKSFSTKKNTAFVYADGGYNLPWLTLKQKDYGYFKAIGGLYADGGVGYQVSVAKNKALLFSLGYCIKKVTNRELIIIDFPPYPTGPIYYNYTYTLNRLSIKAGLRF